MKYLVVLRECYQINFQVVFSSESYDDCVNYLKNGLVMGRLQRDNQETPIPGQQHVCFYDEKLMWCRELFIADKSDRSRPSLRWNNSYYEPEGSGHKMGEPSRLSDWMFHAKARTL